MADPIDWRNESSLELGRAAALVDLCLAHADHAAGGDDARDWPAIAGLLAHVDLLAARVASGAAVAPAPVREAVRRARAVAAIVARETTTAAEDPCGAHFDDETTTFALDALAGALRMGKASIEGMGVQHG